MGFLEILLILTHPVVVVVRVVLVVTVLTIITPVMVVLGFHLV
jgi:hypothetical protein